jgi:hypothetical protein
MNKIFNRYYRYVLDGALPSKEEQIPFSILYDLRSRPGLRQAWDSLDDDIQEEILKEWIKITKEKLIDTK